jgi:hypothetical protein
VFDLDTGRQLGREAISLWNFDTDSWADLACRLAGRNMTRDEWEQIGPRTIEYRATCEAYPLAE